MVQLCARQAAGPGLVSSKASVAATAYVGPDAVVNGGTVSGNARIEDFAVVDGGTISGNAVVRGRALVTAGTVGDDAVLEEDAWLVSGSITGKAKVGALSIIAGSTTVTDNAQVYGVMWAVTDKKLSGTAQLRGDLENNFTKEISKGVFYGMVDDGMLNNASYGANLTTPPTDATASIEKATWYAIKEDSTGVITRITNDSPNRNLGVYKTDNVLQLQLPQGTRSVAITDYQGRILLMQQGSPSTMSIAKLPQGIYYVIVRTEKGKLTKRFVK